MAADEELQRFLNDKLAALGYPIHPYKNDQDGFPFIEIADTFETELETNKTRIGGNIVQYLRVWHNDLNQSGTMRTICSDIIKVLRTIERTENFQWRILPNGVNVNHAIEYSQNVALRRSTIDIEIRYY